jgi:hypothetical protein
MSTIDSQKVILKLNRDTKENKIKWSVVTNFIPSSISGTEVLVGSIYLSKVNDRSLILYKYRHRYYFDEDQYNLVDDIRLEFINKSGISEWEFPQDRAIDDLYETVRYKSAHIDEFFQDFLKEQEEDDDEDDEGQETVK